MSRSWPLVLLLALGFIAAVAVADASPPEPAVSTVTVTRTHTVRKLQSYQGRNVHWWAQRTNYWKRRSIALKRSLLKQPKVSEAINLACLTYAVSCGLMWQLARCESQLYAGAKNRTSTASGLFQMLYPSTWGTTPYWSLSVWSPYANSMAAAHMLAHGRRSEWVC